MAKCKGCHYWRAQGNGSTSGMCHYSLDTGHGRSCSGQECYDNKIHFKPKEKYKPKSIVLSPDTYVRYASGDEEYREAVRKLRRKYTGSEE